MYSYKNYKFIVNYKIDYAIEQAERVPELEKKIKELQEEVDNKVATD
jgi:hypothetical protein